MRSLIFVVALTAGCAQTVWVRPGYGESDFQRDAAQCQYEGAAATANYNTGPTARTTGGAIGQGFGEGIAIALRRNELFALCMRARGYTPQVAGR
jgi:hypothetical protein